MRISFIHNQVNFARRTDQKKSIFPEMTGYDDAFRRMQDSPVLDAISVHTSGESTLGMEIPNTYKDTYKGFYSPVDYVMKTYLYEAPEPTDMKSLRNATGAAKLIRYLEDMLLCNASDRADIKAQIERLKYAMPLHYIKLFNIKL